MVANALSRKAVSMGNLAYIPVGERPLAANVKTLANQFVRLDVSESSRILACTVARFSLYERSLFKITAVPFYIWAPDIYEGSPTPVIAFHSIYGSYGAILQQIFFFCSIASMILGALAAMAQMKVKRLLAHNSIGHVGYIRTGFPCGTIEGIQSLLIGIFIYASMMIDAFAIVLALRQTRVKYIADLGTLAKTIPILAITFSITMFPFAGIPPLTGFCSKFYLFFTALGCGAYFLAPVGVVTSIIGRWAAGRLPRVSKFGGSKAVLRTPDM
ncbi:NADH-ubiquinone oxidoreductase chain 2-like [Nicotiana tomentosiformis]|uniref:NADH-ubiquinone oxidoreductase chain 2-like n=1 Tax=Nicotiana tomentosiformis TaxID=4098 RepID=UPI00388C8260